MLDDRYCPVGKKIMICPPPSSSIEGVSIYQEVSLDGSSRRFSTSKGLRISAGGVEETATIMMDDELFFQHIKVNLRLF
jgi:hypothetical protein